MIALHTCVLYTQDEDLIRRASAYLRELVSMTPADSIAKLQTTLEMTQPCIVLLDLRAKQCRDLLPRVKKGWPATLVIALGIPRSDPMHEAEMAGVYAAEDIEIDRKAFQGLINRAVQHLELICENSSLRQQTVAPPAAAAAVPSMPAQVEPRKRTAAPLRALAHSPVRPGRISELLEHYVQSATEATGAARTGIYFRDRHDAQYALQAHRCCNRTIRSRTFKDSDSLPCWLNARPQMVSRLMLEHVKNPEEHRILEKSLDELGADVILPLHGSDDLLGWLFIGPRFTGIPFDHEDMEELAVFARHVSTALDHAIVYDETHIQRLHLETLLDSMATGVLMAEAGGTIRWMNAAARDMLDLPDEMGTGHHIDVLGSHVTDALQQALDGQEANLPTQWSDQQRKRIFVVRTRPLLIEEHVVGAVALIRDISAEPKPSAHRGDVPDQASFWAELAASMSHEIRNPLVAIKTFAQLLPERFDDKDFREQFSKQVVEEVDRLNGVVDQINAFAYPPELNFRSVDIRKTIRRGMNLALIGQPNHGIKFEIAMDDRLPQISGDEEALSECFTHLFLNSIEAVRKKDEPRIMLSAKPGRDAHNREGILVTVEDNGMGMPEDIRNNVFSPFCTTKARGLGLGLPVVKRTILDHQGDLKVESTDKGTKVSMMLPIESDEGRNETHTDS